ncbi:hypothetical protein E0W68_08500 [Flavobacterium salilacus subsp. salilacus]|uniref:hypothetical protein n=1 Tax=Flavobacterium TaxID=237 RepID=UPI001074AB6A|nr:MULTISPECIES: hypothetical protein [Flavobacterium]KAF2518778.1 hypothetical protein E0W68_08500 [Flavobacterium salilacus subsp. salilacus]MBE1613746.1 hypothetical protein [Flavobacterium sp. SaA2.13]
MKKILFSFALFLAIVTTHAQSAPDFSKYPLNNEKNTRAADATALQAANFLLKTPINFKEADRKSSIAFLIKWMEASPDYTFSLDNSMIILDDDDVNYSALYIAAMAKYQIENKVYESTDDSKVQTWKIIAEYVANPNNNIKVKGKIKKLVEANEKNKLEEFLNKV